MALAPFAARRKPLGDPPLKDSAQWTLIGKPVARLDIPAKTAGTAIFGIDVRVPNMVYAAIRHCPTFGGTVSAVDDSEVRLRPGILAVTLLKEAVAVIADSYWRAQMAVNALNITWNEGSNGSVNDSAILSSLRGGLTSRRQSTAFKRGSVDSAMKRAVASVESEYILPFLAHATMEPMNCTAHVTEDSCTLWAPTQGQSLYLQVLPKLLGLKPEQIQIVTTYLGGGFGRRFESDFGIEAALLSKTIGRPVQLIWSREEDIRRDYYRPAAIHRVISGVDEEGRIAAWRHWVASPSVLSRVFPQMVKDGVDGSAVEGIFDQPYAIPAMQVDYSQREVGVPVGFWRSVGHSGNAIVVESMVDELAQAAKVDPLQFRRGLLSGLPRFQHVLDRVAMLSGWGGPLVSGVQGARRGRGVAIHESFGGVVAEVAEVTVLVDGCLTVDRVWAVIDCGPVVNPDTVYVQVPGRFYLGCLRRCMVGYRFRMDEWRRGISMTIGW
ncbi:hypothetical protein CCP2SC5_1530003 [Azospirillaceae bacterium]